MRILILGGDGMLGHQLLRSLADIHDVRVTLRQPLEEYRAFGLFSAENAYDRVDVRDESRLFRSRHAFRAGRGRQLCRDRETAAGRQVADSVARDQFAAAAQAVGALFEPRYASHPLQHRLRVLGEDRRVSGDRYARSGGLVRPDQAPRGIAGPAGSDAADLDHRTRALAQDGLIERFLAQRGKIRGFRRAVYTGFTTREMGRLVHRLVEEHDDLHGVWQVASAPINQYTLLVELARKLQRSDIEIAPDDTFACDRSLRADRFRAATGYVPPSWDGMLTELADDVRRRAQS